MLNRNKFEHHTFLHHSQTVLQYKHNKERFEHHTFLHHSQTKKQVE